MKKLHLHIFHYHLLPGGVTDVILGWLHLIAAQPKQVFANYEQVVATVVCGRADNVAVLEANFRQGSAGKLPCDFIVDEHLDYRPAEQVKQRIEALTADLLQKYTSDSEDNFWWVHNYHLGKNVAFTGALLRIIAERSLRILLHIHDFPECGRFANYSDLTEHLSEHLGKLNLYPIAAHVCYATINKRDRAILKNAGVPQERLFFLPNPLKFNDLDKAPELREQFAEQFGSRAGRYAPDKPIALYPVRCIRRKNVLELGVLNLLAGEPWNIVCTLPGRSEREKPYSDLVRSLFHHGLIQGCCEVGLDLDARGWSFDMLCAVSELILCSSVMEGFGFTYFNPIYWNKFLVARQLDVLEGFEHCFPRGSSIFYNELKIPLAAGMYHDLRQKYLDYIGNLPSVAATNLLEALEQRLPPQMPDYIDFAFLSVEQQVAVLRRLHEGDEPFRQACCEWNRDLLVKISSRKPNQSRELVAEEFAEDHLRSILRELVASFEGEPISERVLRAFSKLEYNYAVLWDK